MIFFLHLKKTCPYPCPALTKLTKENLYNFLARNPWFFLFFFFFFCKNFQFFNLKIRKYFIAGCWSFEGWVGEFNKFTEKLAKNSFFPSFICLWFHFYAGLSRRCWAISVYSCIGMRVPVFVKIKFKKKIQKKKN